MTENPTTSLDYAEITEQTDTSVKGRFSIDGTEGSIRATMQDEYPASSPGRARVEVTYGDHSFEAYSSNGETPIVRVYGDDWGDTVDGWSGEEISDEALEDWNEAAAAIEEAVGDVDVYTGTEVFKYGEDEDGRPVTPEDRIEAGMDYDVKVSGSSSRVQARTTDATDLEAVIEDIEPALAELVDSGAVRNAWDGFIAGYQDHEFGPF